MRLPESIDRFLVSIQINDNPSERTLINYKHWLKRFLTFCGDVDIESINLMKIDEYKFFLYNLKKEEKTLLSVTTRNHHLVALRSFFKYLLSLGLHVVNYQAIQLAKEADKEINYLTREEVHSLYNAASGDGIRACRNRAILALLFDTGMRVSELAGLNKANVILNLERREFTVFGKGRKLRSVFLLEDTAKKLQEYLQRRTDSFEALFINYKSYRQFKDDSKKRRMHPAAIQRMVKTHARRAGIKKKVTPHTLRHSFCTDLIINGAHLRVAQELMGHAKIETTLRYTHISNQFLKSQYDQYHK